MILILVWRERLRKKKKTGKKKENRLNLDYHLSFVEGIQHRQWVNLTARLHSGCNLGQQIKQVEHQACLNRRKLSAVWQISFDKSVCTLLVYLCLVAIALKINRAGQELVKRTETSSNSAKFLSIGTCLCTSKNSFRTYQVFFFSQNTCYLFKFMLILAALPIVWVANIAFYTCAELINKAYLSFPCYCVHLVYGQFK